jgi:hypothetical protein
MLMMGYEDSQQMKNEQRDCRALYGCKYVIIQYCSREMNGYRE